MKNKTPQEKESEETGTLPGPIRFQHEEKEIALAQLISSKTEIGSEEWARAKKKLEDLKMATLTKQQVDMLETANKKEKVENGKEGHAAASRGLKSLRTALGLGERPILTQTQKKELQESEKKVEDAYNKLEGEKDTGISEDRLKELGKEIENRRGLRKT